METASCRGTWEDYSRCCNGPWRLLGRSRLCRLQDRAGRAPKDAAPFHPGDRDFFLPRQVPLKMKQCGRLSNIVVFSHICTSHLIGFLPHSEHHHSQLRDLSAPGLVLQRCVLQSSSLSRVLLSRWCKHTEFLSKWKQTLNLPSLNTVGKILEMYVENWTILEGQRNFAV